MISQDIKRRLELVSDDGRLAQQLIVLALGEHFSQVSSGLVTSAVSSSSTSFRKRN